MKKRFLTVWMIVCMIISMVPLSGVYAFSDVTEETQYSAAIGQLKEWGKIEGYGDGTYRPEEKITRAEFVKMLMSLQDNSGLEYVQEGAQTGFEDVDNSEEPHWAARYISFAVNKNVINGYGDGTFRPDNQVTYQEALKMVVCLLGYGLRASIKAEEIGLPLWPDAYMSVATDLLLTKSISVDSFAQQASRGAVAQIIYNATSVQEVNPDTLQPIYTTTTAPSGASRPGSSGGGGGGGGGGSSRPGNSISTETKTAYGVIVGTNDIFVDDVAYFANSGRISSAYMIFRQSGTGEYMKLYTGYKASEDGYTSMIGYYVKLTYKEIDDLIVDYQVVSVTNKDTQTITIAAEDIAEAVDNTLYYYDSKGKKQEFDYDIANMQFMYNGEIVRNADGTTTGMENLITEEDLMPEVGTVKLIDTDANGVADYGIIESYTTIVVGTCKTETVQEDPNDSDSRYKRYTVTDKFVTEGEGEEATAKTYTFDSKKLVDEDGKEVSPSLSVWDVVYLAQTKDLSKTIIRVVSKSSAKAITVSEIETDGSGITDGSSSKKTYEASKYFLKYVWDTIKDEALESGVKLTLYLNPDGKIAAAQVGDPSYTVGYLVNAAMNSKTNELELRIVTSGNKAKNESQIYVINKTVKINGQAVDKETVLKRLQDNAAIIRDGKPKHMMANADLAQPIRFEAYGTSSSGQSLIKNLDIIEAAEKYLFKTENATDDNAAKQYITGSSGKGFGGSVLYGIELPIPNTNSSKPTTIIMVPNDRTEAQYYQIGTVSSLESNDYLKAYTYYNVEPYLVKYNDGTTRNDIFVIYYEDTYATASVHSPVAIVKSFTDAVDADGQEVKKIETISASASAGTSTTTYTAKVSEIQNATYYGAQAGADTHKVEVGDVITFGKTMDNTQICNIQILFDASERNTAKQQKNLMLDEGGDVHESSKEEPYYRIVLGTVSAKADEEMGETQASVVVENSNAGIKIEETKTIYGYDPSIANDKPSSVDDDNQTLKFSEYAQVGDYVFVFRSGSNERFIYVVKNQTIVTDGGEDSGESRNEGNEQGSEPSQNESNNQESNGDNQTEEEA